MEKTNRETRRVLETFRLDGRRALVTGGNRGLGRVMAQALAEAGAEVAVASRSLPECQRAAEEIAASTGRKALAFAADLTVAAAAERLVSDVEAGLGPLDILVNNAGVNVRGAAEELSEADWDAVLATNLKAPFLLARAVGQKLNQRLAQPVLTLWAPLGQPEYSDHWVTHRAHSYRREVALGRSGSFVPSVAWPKAAMTLLSR